MSFQRIYRVEYLISLSFEPKTELKKIKNFCLPEKSGDHKMLVLKKYGSKHNGQLSQELLSPVQVRQKKTQKEIFGENNCFNCCTTNVTKTYIAKNM